MAVMEREPAKVQVGSQGSSWLVHHCQLFVEHLQAGKVVCSIQARLEEKLLSSAISCPCFLTAKSWLFNDFGLRFMQFRLSLQFPNFLSHSLSIIDPRTFIHSSATMNVFLFDLSPISSISEPPAASSSMAFSIAAKRFSSSSMVWEKTCWLLLTDPNSSGENLQFSDVLSK